MRTKKSLISLAVMLLASVPVQAAVVFDLKEVGSDVLFTGSGTINLSSLTYSGDAPVQGLMVPSFAYAVIADGSITAYSGLSGPTSIGSSMATTYATSMLGDSFGFFGLVHGLMVPQGYTSGGLLAATATFANQTLATLGATVGTYVWTWGSGPTADSITLNVGNVTAVPEPSAYALALAGLGVMGFWGRRQKATRPVANSVTAAGV